MLTVRLDSPVPLADQIVAGVRDAIARGEVGAGDELPPVRQLAGDLGINLNTVARAYRELEAQGLVRTARGRGTRVTASREVRRETDAEQSERVSDGVRRALTDARLAGLSRAEALALVRRHLATLWPARRKAVSP